jgi:hypothetical protein
MLSAGAWRINQPNTILFVLVDSSGNEVAGIGSAFVLQISKAGAVFSASAGTKSEVSNGWYKYVTTAAEADTSGPVAIRITHASTVQQNLEYVVQDRVESAVEFTYTLTSTVGGVPIVGAEVLVYTDSGATNFVWGGNTDAFGVARDPYGALPRLEAGAYAFFRYKTGFVFSNPDLETVS